MEIWKDVKGHEGHHQVSNYGRIKSLERVIANSDGVKQLCEGKILSTRIDKYGYERIALRINGKRKYTTVHRLVAESFIPNPKNKSQVNHIDENKANNHISNLEWNTAKENMSHNNLRDRIALKLRKKVNSYDLNGILIKEYDLIEATKTDGFIPCKVSACCKGKRISHGNRTWKYA